MAKVFRAVGLASTGLVATLVVLAAPGWLYVIQPRHAVPGPQLPTALPLDELSRRSAVPLVIFVAVWVAAGIALGLLARLARGGSDGRGGDLVDGEEDVVFGAGPEAVIGFVFDGEIGEALGDGVVFVGDFDVQGLAVLVGARGEFLAFDGGGFVDVLAADDLVEGGEIVARAEVVVERDEWHS